MLTDRTREVRGGIGYWLTAWRHHKYASAVCRIGVGLAVTGLLITNFSTRDVWAGQASVWATPAREALTFPEIALLSGASSDVVTAAYVMTLLAAMCLTAGFLTRPANAVTFIGFVTIVSQNPVVGQQSDTIIRLALLWMIVMRTSDVWSVDRWRRERRTGYGNGYGRRRMGSFRSWDSADILPEWLLTGLHNVGLLALAGQVALMYLAGGLDKVSDKAWQHGTALFSTLQLPEFRFYPWVSDLISHNTVLLAMATYAVLLSQLFFVPLLLNRVARAVVIWAAIVVNAFFGLLFAQPWAGIAVIAVTLIFASDESLQRVAFTVRPVTLRAGKLTGNVTATVAGVGYVAVDWLTALWTDYVLTAYDAVKFKITGR